MQFLNFFEALSIFQKPNPGLMLLETYSALAPEVSSSYVKYAQERTQVS
jgi:hypothetical protein